MNKYTLIIALLFSSVIFSQTKEDALRDAKITSKATLEMDFETVLKHTHPNVVKLMGGMENAVSAIRTAFEGMTSQGFVFEKAEVISVSDIVQEQGEYRCFIEGQNQMKMGDMRIKSKSYLLGVYDDDKQIWYYLEAKQLKNPALLEQVIPNFKTSLEIPDDEVSTEKI